MTYKRDPDAAVYVRDSNHPATKFMGRLFAFLFMPLLVVAAWWKAQDFDPYTSSFFTKEYVEPTASYVTELRIGGAVIVVLGIGLVLAAVNGVRKKRVAWKEIWIVPWCGVLIALFGGAFFIAANASQERIEQEMAVEAGKT